MKRLKQYWIGGIAYLTRMQTHIILSLLSYPCVSSAQDLEGIITNATHFLRGRTASAAGVLGIMITGYLCLVRQTFPKEYFMMVLVGMGLIFGSASLYNTLVGM